MSLCGVNPKRTYQEVEEALRMIGSMWQTDTFEWEGELLTVKAPSNMAPHPVLPRPVQQPHPPLYLACTKRETVTLAADYGIGALVLGFAGVDEVRELRKIYDEAIAVRTGERFVSTVVNNHFSALCPTIVMDDAQEALNVGARGQRFFAEAIAHWYGSGPPPKEDTEGDDNVVEIKRDEERVIAWLHESKIPVHAQSTSTFNIDHAYGDADRAIGYVEQLEDAGADEIMCLIQMGTVPQEACLETIRQWGAKVIPHFRRQEG
jgi:alkanesulfonate monooxygenase SsuD/methylene tetrahydromethanopterin reductase-like flavin-dependent oxidoreductase (luciferase family)